MMMYAVLSNPNHPEYGVATIPFPIPHDQYAHCMELLEALEIGDAAKADCKVEEIDSFFSVLKRTEMLTVNVEELNYLAKAAGQLRHRRGHAVSGDGAQAGAVRAEGSHQPGLLLPAGHGHHRLFRPRRHRP